MKILPLVLLLIILIIPFGSSVLEVGRIRGVTSQSTTTSILLGNLTHFTQLTDTPSSYSGEGGNCVQVTGGETGLEFGACGTGNASWNESYANSLYLPHTVIWDATFNASFDDRDQSGGNASWTENYANTKYLKNYTYNVTYDAYSYNVSLNRSISLVAGYGNLWLSTYNATYDAGLGTNYTAETVTGYDTKWSATNNATYDAYATNVSNNWTEDVVTGYDTAYRSTYNATYAALGALWDTIFNTSLTDFISPLNTTYNSTYASYATNVSINYTEKTVAGYDAKWSSTYNATYASNVGNLSWNQTAASRLYLENYTYNATYASYSTNVSINYTEQVVTGYDTAYRSTYNATYASQIDNTSWNQTAANKLYLQNYTYNATYASYSTNVSNNWTEDVVIGYDEAYRSTYNATYAALGVLWDAVFNLSLTDYISPLNTTYNATYASYATNVSINYTEQVVTGYDEAYRSTYNATYADNEGNLSWNQTAANKLYLQNYTYNATYANYATNVSNNWTEDVVTGYDEAYRSTYNATYDALGALWDAVFNLSLTDYIQPLNTTYNATYASYSTNVSNNWTEDVVTGYDAAYRSTYNATYASNVGNLSWNQTLANSLYLPHTVIWDTTFNASFDDRDQQGGNASFNQTTTNKLYLQNWTYNATYASYATNVSLNRSISLVAGYGDLWLSTYNATYAALGAIWDSVFNLSLTDYIAPLNTTYNATYASYATNVSNNWTEDVVTGYDTAYRSTYNATYAANVGNASWTENYANTKYLKNYTYNATYAAYSTNVSINWTAYTYTAYDTKWTQVLWDAAFNLSFDDRDQQGTGNASWNQTTANKLYLQNWTYNATYANYAANVSLNRSISFVAGYDALYRPSWTNVCWINESNTLTGDQFVVGDLNVTENLNVTMGNITMAETYSFCFNAACTKRMFANSTSINIINA